MKGVACSSGLVDLMSQFDSLVAVRDLIAYFYIRSGSHLRTSHIGSYRVSDKERVTFRVTRVPGKHTVVQEHFPANRQIYTSYCR
jgi:hypothetical protein